MTAGADEYEERWTFWGRVQWLWDHGGAFLATFGMILLLFGLSGWLAKAFFQLDAEFSRPLAGDVIPPEVTQTVAQGIRLFTLISGSLAIYFHVNNMPAWRRGAIWLGGVGAVLVMAHAYGIAAKIMEGQYSRAKAVEVVAQASVTTVTDQIADIDAAIIRAASDRDAALLVAQQTIDSVKDQVVGLSAADNATIQKANTDKATALAAYNAKVVELEAQKQALRTSEGQAVSTQATDTSMVETFNPLFTFLARLTTLNFNPAIDPPDGHKYVWGAVFFTALFGFGEIALMFALTGAFAALKVVSERKRQAAPDEAEPGKVIIKMTEQEAAEMQEALAQYARLREGHMRGGETNKRRTRQDTKRLEAAQYMEKRAARVLRQRRTGASVSDISKSLGVTPAVLGLEMRQWLTDAEYAYVFDGGPDPANGDSGENISSGA